MNFEKLAFMFSLVVVSSVPALHVTLFASGLPDSHPAVHPDFSVLCDFPCDSPFFAMNWEENNLRTCQYEVVDYLLPKQLKQIYVIFSSFYCKLTILSDKKVKHRYSGGN